MHNSHLSDQNSYPPAEIRRTLSSLETLPNESDAHNNDVFNVLWSGFSSELKGLKLPLHLKLYCYFK